MKQKAYFTEGTLAAWRKAGAKLGWLGINEELKMEFAEQPERLKNAVPAFEYTGDVREVTHGQAAPGIPFGLNIKNKMVRNVKLPDLARLTDLQSLGLNSTLMAYEGMKDLAPLINLQSLDLSYNRLEDAGPKVYVPVTDQQGLKDLAPLTNLKSL